MQEEQKRGSYRVMFEEREAHTKKVHYFVCKKAWWRLLPSRLSLASLDGLHGKICVIKLFIGSENSGGISHRYSQE